MPCGGREGYHFDVGRLAPLRWAMASPLIDLTPLRKALAMLREALAFWNAQPDGAPLKPHLRSAVIQSFEFTYELSVRLLRRVLIERVESADRVVNLSFNDLLRSGADAGLLAAPDRWREWREMRNATTHAYDETTAQAVAARAAVFVEDAAALLSALEVNLAK